MKKGVIKMNGKFNWGIVASAVLGFIIGVIVGWAVWGQPTPVEAGTCEKEHSACDINNNDKLCCAGLTCMDKGVPSRVGKCEVKPRPTPIPTDVPSVGHSRECGEITMSFHNPTPWLFVFDYRVDGEPYVEDGTTDPWYGIPFNSSSPLHPGTFGARWHEVVLVGGHSQDVTLNFGEDTGVHQVEWRLAEGAEQDMYFDWTSVRVESDCEVPDILVCLDGEEELTIPRTAEAWKRVLYSWPDAYLGECEIPDVPDEPEVPVTLPEEEHHEAPMPSAPEHCVNVPTPDNPANFHLYRKGDCAELKWMPTDGDTVNIYWKNPASGNWEHSLINSPNDGVEMICGLENYDWSFGLAQVNENCNQSDIMEVEDGNTPDWVLFR